MLTLWGCAETAASQSRPQPHQPTELEAGQVTDTEHIHKGTGSRKDREAFMAKGERLRGGGGVLGSGGVSLSKDEAEACEEGTEGRKQVQNVHGMIQKGALILGGGRGSLSLLFRDSTA